MNKTENNRELIEILMIVLLTFIIVFLLRSSFNRRSNKVVVKVSNLTGVTGCREIMSSENKMLDCNAVPSGIQRSL